MPTAKFRVPDLASAADERLLVARLTQVAGVYGAVANSAEHCLEIDFEDDEVHIAELIAAARSAGFTASLVG